MRKDKKDTTKKRLLDRHEKKKQPTNSTSLETTLSSLIPIVHCEKVELFTVFRD